MNISVVVLCCAASGSTRCWELKARSVLSGDFPSRHDESQAAGSRWHLQAAALPAVNMEWNERNLTSRICRLLSVLMTSPQAQLSGLTVVTLT